VLLPQKKNTTVTVFTSLMDTVAEAAAQDVMAFFADERAHETRANEGVVGS